MSDSANREFILQQLRHQNLVFKVRPSGVIDVFPSYLGAYAYGGVQIELDPLSRLPVRFGIVSESFYLRGNNLASLEGCPYEVGGRFQVGPGWKGGRTKLSSLTHCPKIVRGSFEVEHTEIKTLEGMPEQVGGDIFIPYNRLISLEGCPSIVHGSFHCSSNKLETLEGGPHIVEGHFSCARNPLTSLRGAPAHVKGYFSAASCLLTSIKGIPADIGGQIFLGHNPVKLSVRDVRKYMKARWGVVDSVIDKLVGARPL
jgi:hypothetical protein